MLNYKNIAKTTLKLLNSGYKEEAIQILERSVKEAFGWKKLPILNERDSEINNFMILLHAILHRYPPQRSGLAFGRQKAFAPKVIEPIYRYIIGYKPKKPWFQLEKLSAPQLVQTLQNSPKWKLWEKFGARYIFVTRQTSIDRDANRDDLVFVADIRTNKDRVALYFAHLGALGTSFLHLLNQFKPQEDVVSDT